jgi:hypothetical protein
MDHTIGKEYDNLLQREAFIRDNCDKVERKGYMRQYSRDELQQRKEKLATLSIEIAEITTEKKAANQEFKTRLDPLKLQHAEVVSQIKAKSEYVDEECYKYIDQEAREVAYYNKAGDCIEVRPATADEMQVTIFQASREQNVMPYQKKAM